jgi:hypothetical protein
MTLAHRAGAAGPAADISVPDLHHGSHNHLLTPVSAPPTRLDAIIVPTFRPPDVLRDAMRLARELDCPLLVLCSGSASAKQVAGLGSQFDVDVSAIDLRDVRPSLPTFQTDELLELSSFQSGSDLSRKRNLGLLLGRAAGWERVLFLDDDIYRIDPAGLRSAAGALDDPEIRVVGLRNAGYPDNSVVCHAYRAIGAQQDSFIGGGAMLVRPGESRSFFPNIYNEDWLFLLGEGVPFKAGIAGSMMQRDYDPFANPQRASREELGDTLAEGLYWLLDHDRPLVRAEASFWGDFLYRRRRFLDHLLDCVDTAVSEPQRREPIKASVRAARGRSSFIRPTLCHAFFGAWIADLATWRLYLEPFGPGAGLDKALSQLGLSHVVHRSADAGRNVQERD